MRLTCLSGGECGREAPPRWSQWSRRAGGLGKSPLRACYSDFRLNNPTTTTNGTCYGGGSKCASWRRYQITRTANLFRRGCRSAATRSVRSLRVLVELSATHTPSTYPLLVEWLPRMPLSGNLFGHRLSACGVCDSQESPESTVAIASPAGGRDGRTGAPGGV